MPAAPIAARRPQVITQHGRERVDEYAWLKDPAWQEVMRDPARLDPAIRAHLEAENAYTEAMTAASAGLRETLFQEMKGRIKDDDASAPSPDGPYSYYIRFAPGAQHPIHARSLREGGSEEILLDEEALAQGGAYCSVAAAHHSP
ncbi:MAG: S9 family peptidase, partial [Hyphomonadaceae bacterium]|nr:S9 family peptidase [Hyphomonadaceae bacterium]